MMRMAYLRNSVLILLSVFAAHACSGSKSFVSFEVLQPGDITYPKNVNKVAFLNRAPVSRDAFSRINNKSIDNQSVKMLDTIVCNNLRRGFFEAVEGSELIYLDDILLLESRRKDTSNQAEEMSARFRNNLFAGYDVDALVVLEYYSIEVKQAYSRYDFYIGDYVQEISVSAEILWRLYSKGKEDAIDNYLFSDTLFYLNQASFPSEQYVTGIKALRDGATDFGYAYGMRHVPYWADAVRIIYRGGCEELRKAAELTDKGDWENAARLWGKITDDEDKKIAGRAHYNLAVYYELQDEIAEANSIITQAFKQWNTSEIATYKQELDKRLENKTKVLRQLRVQ